jgi:hypothetical protein
MSVLPVKCHTWRASCTSPLAQTLEQAAGTGSVTRQKPNMLNLGRTVTVAASYLDGLSCVLLFTSGTQHATYSVVFTTSCHAYCATGVSWYSFTEGGSARLRNGEPVRFSAGSRQDMAPTKSTQLAGRPAPPPRLRLLPAHNGYMGNHRV